jgi:hypothetical protein
MRFAISYEKLMGADPKWNRINKSFQVVYLVLSIPLYFLGSSEPSVREVVYYIWRAGIFGMWSNDIPYTCYNFGGIPGLCPQSFLQVDEYLDPSIALLGYVIDGAISLRIITFCLERFEVGLGANVLSGIIDRLLPKPKDHHYHQYIGEVHMGDVFKNISNSTIVSRSKLERAFNRLQESGQGEGAKLLVEIGKHVSDANNVAAGAVYSQMTDELSKPTEVAPLV